MLIQISTSEWESKGQQKCCCLLWHSFTLTERHCCLIERKFWIRFILCGICMFFGSTGFLLLSKDLQVRLTTDSKLLTTRAYPASHPSVIWDLCQPTTDAQKDKQVVADGWMDYKWVPFDLSMQTNFSLRLSSQAACLGVVWGRFFLITVWF